MQQCQTNCIGVRGGLNKRQVRATEMRECGPYTAGRGTNGAEVCERSKCSYCSSQAETSLTAGLISPCLTYNLKTQRPSIVEVPQSAASLLHKNWTIVLDRPCVQYSTVLWYTQPSRQYLFWTDRLFSTALCSDAHSHYVSICSGQTVCSVQHCTLLYTAINSVFVLNRACVQFNTVLWYTQPSLRYLFWTDRVFSSTLCSDVHSHHFGICSGQTVCSVQHCAQPWLQYMNIQYTVHQSSPKYILCSLLFRATCFDSYRIIFRPF
jgi:hypothetical protein